mgnify:CR=1 FL=1
MDDYFKYFGLDWLGMIITLVAVYLLGNKNRNGFIVFAFANVLWMYIGYFLMSSLGILFGNIFFLVTNIRGYFNWKKEQEKSNS